MSQTLRIAQLYADELGVTGDRGNVLALQARWERFGGDAVRVLVGRGDEIPADTDIVVIGNGPLSAMRLVLSDLREKAGSLETLVAQGAPLLAVGGGAELLGESVETLEGETLTGVGLFPFRVHRVRDRRVGYVVADTEHGRLVGFEDHASDWTLGDGAVEYGVVTAGKGSFARTQGRGEGVRRGDAYALNVQGPVLPLNPQLTDVLLSAAASRRGVEYRTGEAHAEIDRLAAGAREAILARAGKVFNSMGV
ncbi:type 1 glutamine amidotransferase [Microbacterium cremeum]|uniref:type 1 glutamine amidotransferase n=1 Tax=Microbacterium cremeum TaxID=2782169 RepID=UPI001887BFC0|nr:glutamine amidotransferase [Microbacterium cremeum]